MNQREERFANSFVFWLSGLIGILDISMVSLNVGRHRSDVLAWMSFGIVVLTVIGIFIGSALLRKTLLEHRAEIKQKAFSGLTSAVSAFPMMAFIGIQAAMSFAR